MTAAPMTDADALARARTVCAGVPSCRLLEREGGAVIEIATSAAFVTIALQRAQVLSWRPAHADRDVLWCPPHAVRGGGRAIRGGVPICWPWFGPDPHGRAQHGFARNRLWRLERLGIDAAGTVSADFSTDGSTDPQFGPDVTATLTLEAGATLALALMTANGSIRAVPISSAFHPYFAVSDVRSIAVDGFDGAAAVDLDKAGAAHLQAGPIRFETGRTLRFDVAPRRAVIDDPAFARRITIDRGAGRSAVVWHPGPAVAAMADVPSDLAFGFVCVESGDVGTASVVVEPGARHHLAVRYAVGGLA
jgi:glucose-6-phosphate 1-epimerase